MADTLDPRLVYNKTAAGVSELERRGGEEGVQRGSGGGQLDDGDGRRTDEASRGPAARVRAVRLLGERRGAEGVDCERVVQVPDRAWLRARGEHRESAQEHLEPIARGERA